ncbi:MAG TPA: Rid family hydrolase [Gaiellaceae bacterium]|jgi:enamine deaminase RidA (YjgF/YER057c/UK114 family)
MAEPRFLVPKGYGEFMRDTYHYSQGVRVGDLVFVTGQGGWDDAFEIPDDVGAQIRNAFRNIETVLAEAQLTWADVIDITSYHVGIEESVLATVVEELRRYCPDHQPLWTVIGVAALALPAMKVEITANAVART